MVSSGLTVYVPSPVDGCVLWLISAKVKVWADGPKEPLPKKHHHRKWTPV